MAIASSAAGGPVFRPDDQGRMLLDTAPWRFKLDNAVRGGVGLKEGWHLAEHDDSDWKTIPVGVRWESQGYNYDGVAWYRCRFYIPESWKGRTLVFDLGRPDDRGRVFINGKQVAHIPEYGPHFAFSLAGEPLRYGEENVIAVQISDWYMYGGLNEGTFRIQLLQEVFRPAGGDVIPLDGGRWRFKLDNAVRDGVGMKEGWHLPEHDDSNWDLIRVGVNWESEGYDYNGVAWYRCRFFLPESWKGESLIMDLGRPDDRGTVFLNGKQVADIPKYGPHFVIPVKGEPLRHGAENVIAVRLSDWYMYGGLNAGTFRIRRIRPFTRKPGGAEVKDRLLSVTQALKDDVLSDPAFRHGWRDEGTSDTRPRYSAVRNAFKGGDALAMDVWYPNSAETLDYRLPEGGRGGDWEREGYEFISFWYRSDETEGDMSIRLNKGDNRWQKGVTSYGATFLVKTGGWHRVVLPFASFRGGGRAMTSPAGLDTLAIYFGNNHLRRPGTILFAHFEVGRLALSDVARTIPLVEPWRFKTDSVNPDGTPVKRGGAPGAEGSGLAGGWHKEDFDDSSWTVIRAGLEWEHQGYNYDGAAWYRQKVLVPAEWKNLPLRLQLGQPDDRGELYWNGTEVQKVSSYGPYFSVVIPPESVRYGKLNTIAVRVVDWYVQGGLTKGPFTLGPLTDGEILFRRAGDAEAVPADAFEMGPRPDGREVEIVFSLPGILTEQEASLDIWVTDCFYHDIAADTLALTRRQDRLEGVLSLNPEQSRQLYYGEWISLRGLVSDEAGRPLTGVSYPNLRLSYQTRDELALPGLPETRELTPFGRLRLVDVIDCGTDPQADPHPYKEGGVRGFWGGRRAYAPWERGVVVNTFQDRRYREANNNQHFGYRIGRGAMKFGAQYLLRIRYPEDKTRYAAIDIKAGRNYQGVGFRTGVTPDNPVTPYPLSGGYEWSDHVVSLDTVTYGFRGTRSAASTNGFWVFFHDIGRVYASQYDSGPAVAEMRLYEIGRVADAAPVIRYPEGRPRRVLMMDWERQPEADPAGVAEYARLIGLNALGPVILKWGGNGYFHNTQGFNGAPTWFGTSPHRDGFGNTNCWRVLGLWLDATRQNDVMLIPRLEYGGSSKLPEAARVIGRNGKVDPCGRYSSWGANLLHPATLEDARTLIDEAVGKYAGDYPNLGGFLWRMRSDRVKCSYGKHDVGLFCRETGRKMPEGDAAAIAKWAWETMGRAYHDWWHGKRRDFHVSLRDHLRGHRSDLKLYYYNWDPDGWGLTSGHNSLQDWSDQYNVNRAHLHYARKIAAQKQQTDMDYVRRFVGGGHHLVGEPHKQLRPELYRDVDGIALFAPVHWHYLADNEPYIQLFETGDGLAVCNQFSYEEKGRTNIQNDNYETSEMSPGGPPFAMADEVLSFFHGDPNVITWTPYTIGRSFVTEHRRFAQAFLALPATRGTRVPHPNPDVRVRTYSGPDGRVYVSVAHRGFEPATITVTVPGATKGATVTDLVSGEPVTAVFTTGAVSFTVSSDAMQLNSFVVSAK